MDPRVKELQKYKVPRDEEDNRYVKDFAIDDEEGYKAFFERFGFVVVRDVLTLDECNRSVSDLYDIIEDGCAFRRDDVRTWNNFPANSIPRYGSPSRPPIFNRQFVLNRQNPNAYRVFSTLMNEPDLVVNHDRGCFFRPAMVDMGDGKLTKMKDWSTNDNLHLDMNPWNWMGDGSFVRGSLERLKYTGIQSADFIAENNQPCHLDGLQLQGVLNLADNFEEDGGFICVPGFYHHFHEFYSADPAHSEDGSSYNFRKSDPVFRLYKRVPMRPGSMVVWDQRMPHGSQSNNSSRPRVAQFLKMFPKRTISDARRILRRAAMLRNLEHFGILGDVTDLGRHLFDLD